MTNPEGLKARAKALRLHGLLTHWSEAVAEPAPARGWIEPLLDWEEQERARRSLERRLQDAHIGRFKSVCDFDWTWPKRCDRATFEALMSLDFLKDATNVVLVGPNGVGKTTLARNLAHQALIHGLYEGRGVNRFREPCHNPPHRASPIARCAGLPPSREGASFHSWHEEPPCSAALSSQSPCP